MVFYYRALTDRTVWAWGQLGFQESLLLAKKYISTKIKKFWEETVQVTSPKKSKRRLESVEEKMDTVFYVLSCR